MDTTHAYNLRMTEQDRNITEAVSRERSRLRSFIRRRMSALGDAEDILQEVFFAVTHRERVITTLLPSINRHRPLLSICCN